PWGTPAGGGLAPGPTTVVRALGPRPAHASRVRRIYGFRYGYAGLAHPDHHEPTELLPDVVEHVHERGGTALGSSRGPQDLDRMIDTLLPPALKPPFLIRG